METLSLKQAIKTSALEIGFDLVGVAPAGPFPEQHYFEQWLARGYAGEMTYLLHGCEKRLDLRLVLPEVKSVVVCGLSYATDFPYSISRKDPGRGWISRYAWGQDYHQVLLRKLQRLLERIQQLVGAKIAAKMYVDTGPILERVLAKYAGLGWWGKNTSLLNPRFGSWFFLGEILLDLELPADEPMSDRCGTCRRCIDACPTGALVAPYVLDARRCIAYLTIESRSAIPLELRPLLQNHIFGCDICQEVCPWNRKPQISSVNEFQPRDGFFNPDLAEFTQMVLRKFIGSFKGSPLRRSKQVGLLRNVAVAMGNSAELRFFPWLKMLTKHEDELVKEHACWAIETLQKVCQS
ncbi:tRNA epoxyqueuosine(34) reductase QueG [candidate division KSB1 bacterium]|nr:MAG: tRNA epoxyqueuosine(34) reductase QueG [candidate division KSB1 bacterium]